MASSPYTQGGGKRSSCGAQAAALSVIDMPMQYSDTRHLHGCAHDE